MSYLSVNNLITGHLNTVSYAEFLLKSVSILSGELIGWIGSTIILPFVISENLIAKTCTGEH